MSTFSENILSQTQGSKGQDAGPNEAKAAVLGQSAPIPQDAVSVVGPDLMKVKDVKGLMESFARIGFQATSLARAIEIVQNMACTAPLHMSITNDPFAEKVAAIR
jgi:hypothetical protein